MLRMCQNMLLAPQTKCWLCWSGAGNAGAMNLAITIRDYNTVQATEAAVCAVQLTISSQTLQRMTTAGQGREAHPGLSLLLPLSVSNLFPRTS